MHGYQPGAAHVEGLLGTEQQVRLCQLQLRCILLSEVLVLGTSSIWTLYAREGCAHSGLIRTSLGATVSRCASLSFIARCSSELRKHRSPRRKPSESSL